ncbi:hypothetical protein WA026_009007 [Henosepilachna vigintioctopunctata]
MRFAIFFVLVITSYACALEDEKVLQQFQEFQEEFGKSYRSPLEARKRLGIFKNSLDEIEKHNALYEKGMHTYQKGINQFADWSDDEFMEFVNKGKKNKPEIIGQIFKKTPNFTAPDWVDWRKKGAVTPVKFQGECGSCWAFSTTGTVEGQLQIKTGKLTSLSEQNLMDCSWSNGNTGCQGGEVFLALDYVRDHGIQSEEDYPYVGKNDHNCKSNDSKIVTKISSYVTVEKNDEEAAREALATKGPLSVAIIANRNLKLYKFGYYSDPTCHGKTNHGVLMVGYGKVAGKNHYVLKNSWGTTWGEMGYIRFMRYTLDYCGVLSEVRYPVL